MSQRLLLDTNVLIDAERHLPQAIGFLRSRNGDDIAISLITYGEVLQGALWIEHAPSALRRMMHAIEEFEVLPVSRTVIERAAFLRGERRKAGDIVSLPDALIAATAIESQRILVTRNTRHFERISGLALLNPY